GFSLFSKKYSQSEVREIWFQGIELGLERGFDIGLPSGKVVDMKNMTPKQEKFYKKFLKLCEDYNCCIQYSPHSDTGMFISDLNPQIKDVVEYSEEDVIIDSEYWKEINDKFK